jgi:recombination protein RecT
MSGEIVEYKQKLKSFRTTLARMGPQIAMAAPDHIKARRMMRMCMTVVQQNPKLLDCTRESLLGAIMTSAQLGLYPDVSVLGHAYFVPFKGKVVFIAGYKGLIDLAGRGGMVTSIQPYPVREGDFFEYEYGLNPTLRHKPSDEPQEGREFTHFYCIARIRGEPIAQFMVMTKEEVDNIMARSPARHKGPWKTDYEPMGMKSVVRRQVKYLPISSELQRAVALDEHADVGLDQGLESVGEEAIEGLLPEDEVVLDAEYTVEKEEGDERASVLDDLTEKMDRDEPDEYVKLWAKGNDIFGDEEWGKTVTALKKKVGAKPEDRMNDEQKINLMALMEAAIKKGG